jgi:hypothetical protein
MVVAILHQAVASYASSLPVVQRKEWEKVSSRFEEVVFAPPIEQTAKLVAAALDVDLAAAPADETGGSCYLTIRGFFWITPL